MVDASGGASASSSASSPAGNIMTLSPIPSNRQFLQAVSGPRTGERRVEVFGYSSIWTAVLIVVV